MSRTVLKLSDNRIPSLNQKLTLFSTKPDTWVCEKTRGRMDVVIRIGAESFQSG
jgi:hypothetical protein